MRKQVCQCHSKALVLFIISASLAPTQLTCTYDHQSLSALLCAKLFLWVLTIQLWWVSRAVWLQSASIPSHLSCDCKLYFPLQTLHQPSTYRQTNGTCLFTYTQSRLLCILLYRDNSCFQTKDFSACYPPLPLIWTYVYLHSYPSCFGRKDVHQLLVQS